MAFKKAMQEDSSRGTVTPRIFFAIERHTHNPPHPFDRAYSLTRHGLDAGPVITLTVDDCWKTHAHSFGQAFDSMSLRGVFYVVAGFVGKKVNGFQFVEWDALRQMSVAGHEIGSHSFTHRGSVLSLTTKATQLFRLVRSKGLVRTTKLTRGLLWIADKWVDEAVSKNLWLIEVFHAMNLPHYPYSCSESALEEHLSHIRSRQGELDNLTVSETIERIRGSLPSGPPFPTVS